MKTVLIVDDFLNTRKVVELVVKNLGDFNILLANDGQEAMDILDGRTKVDIVVTDLNMPRVNGIELTKYIRSTEEYGYIPVMMLTTEINPEKKQMAMEAEVTCIFKKPFSTEEFKEVFLKLTR